MLKVHVRHLGGNRYETEVFAGRSKKPIKVREWTYEDVAGSNTGTLTLTLPKDAFQIFVHSSDTPDNTGT